VGGEAPVTPVSTFDSSYLTFPTNRAITVTIGEMPGGRNLWWETKVEIFGLIPRSR
jgi:hypothetical protein